mgnify:CR=1 FL=1
MLIMTTTLTATSMSTAEQRLRLMQLASSNLPVGGYSWSQGLEWAVEAGWVPDAAAFERWQQQQMEQSFFTVDLPLFARLYRACEIDDLPSAQRWTAWLLACRETRELREEERNRGAAFARLLADWALTTQDIARVTIYAASGNVASQKAAIAAGFVHEGTKRSGGVTHRGRVDLELFGKIRSDIAS